jgi:hypothetical protein
MAEDSGEVDRVAVEKEARAMGWVPEADFKGPKEAFVDAPDFVERGRQILPIVQQNNRRLQQQMAEMQAQLQEANEAARASAAAVAAIEEANERDLEARTEQLRKDIRAELEQASRDGDHKAVADLTVQLTELSASDKDADDADKANKQRKLPARTVVIPPEIRREVEVWYTQNPEYKTDRRRMALGNVISAELREEGNMDKGAAFLDKVRERVEEAMTGTRPQGSSRVAADNGGQGRQNNRTQGKTYADLPPEAKAACDRQGARLIGPGRAHKDVKSWRESYTRQYFAE